VLYHKLRILFIVQETLHTTFKSRFRLRRSFFPPFFPPIIDMLASVLKSRPQREASSFAIASFSPDSRRRGAFSFADTMASAMAIKTYTKRDFCILVTLLERDEIIRLPGISMSKELWTQPGGTPHLKHRGWSRRRETLSWLASSFDEKIPYFFSSTYIFLGCRIYLNLVARFQNFLTYSKFPQVFENNFIPMGITNLSIGKFFENVDFIRLCNNLTNLVLI
jgi:hypothetical protein